ncbi:MAG: PhzF family phenazine biosynthesis protein [Saprospiraceae bacterium]
MEINVQIINAFVDGDRGGNPAGVVLDADHLSNAAKQQIAAKVGLSETAFVSKSNIADFKLDFFTPNRQIAHCGHATIGTFSYLQQLNRIPQLNTSKETIDGRREILIRGELAFMEQKAPIYTAVNHLYPSILQSLNASADILMPNAPIQVVNTGNSFLIIPVQSAQILQNIHPNMAAIQAISDELDLIGYYIFTSATVQQGRDAGTRMFAPRYGIVEESGTGMAAGPLACYLHDILGIRKSRFLIEQGQFMTTPSPSLIEVELNIDNQKVTSLMAGGKGIVSGNRTVII